MSVHTNLTDLGTFYFLFDSSTGADGVLHASLKAQHGCFPIPTAQYGKESEDRVRDGG